MFETVNFLSEKTNGFKPETAIVLGSGLGSFVENLEGISIDYSEVPGFKTSTVEGHSGKLLFCKIEGKNCVVMQGRFHYYEGYSQKETTFPIKIFKKLGVKNLILTNAAGSANPEFKPSDIMVIKDHINFTGTNPLIGPNDNSLGVRFPDMSEVYCREFIQKLKNQADKLNIEIKQGVYLSTTGPSYETPAEIKMFHNWGADAVGMSTVSEAIVGKYCAMDVLGVSLITNYAAGLNPNKLTHAEVIETGKAAGDKLSMLLKEFIKYCI